jgi:glyoxylase-like metal-dependent hydrolase (beta-lactamase superfamily II)
MLPPDEFRREDFQVIKTPGHAGHHISLVYQDYLFVGDAGGVYIDLGKRLYLRPATPPRFNLEEAVGSIDRLLRVKAREICYAHFGIHPDAKGMLERYRNQLYLWRDVIVEQMRHSDGGDAFNRSIKALLERDDLFKPFTDLSEEEKGREIYFVKNGFQGISEYIASRP